MEGPAEPQASAPSPGEGRRGRARRRPRGLAWAAIAGAAAYSWVWVANAFLTDDPYIDFRTIEQLVAGNGLRFNLNERVQAFTDPLWLFLLALPRLAGAALPEVALALSWLAMIGFLAVLWRLSRGEPARWGVAVAVAAVSRTLLDWSSSGLETPLTMLLIAVWVAELLARERREAAGVSPSSTPHFLVISALLLTRPDLAPIAAPAAFAVAWRRVRAVGWAGALREALVGGSPLLAWSLFALVYYGSIVPNTALAKLASGVPARQLVAHGLVYLRVSALWDPLLVPILAAALWAILAAPSRAVRWLGWGALLDLAYVVRAGGDYMAGRFLVPVAALSLCLVAARLPRPPLVAALLPLTLAVGFLASHSPLRTFGHYEAEWEVGSGSEGIADMKGVEGESLIVGLRRGWPKPESYRATRPCIARTLGHLGYRAALDQIIVDPFALSDPLLARLRYQPPWEIGHFRRQVPPGYLESLVTRRNRLEDPRLREVYADVRTVVSAPLLDPGRLAADWRLLRRRPLALEPRCPRVVLGELPPQVPTWPAIVTARRDAPVAIHLRGILPLGKNAEIWQLRVDTALPVATAHLTCHPADSAAQLGFDLELQLRKIVGTVAGRTERLRLALVRDPLLGPPAPLLCAELRELSGIDRPIHDEAPGR